jgi:hypothetical protein
LGFYCCAVGIEGDYLWNTNNIKDTISSILLNPNQDTLFNKDFLMPFQNTKVNFGR